MIYCVVPQPLEAELFDKLSDYYKDDPNVTVIVDRREGQGGAPGPHPADRDRRRRRAKGTFPPIGPLSGKS
ncbi:MAG: hypothetical protein H0U24_07345 [Thermoleophilaceae bacterium]|nr:hypothetical protein [Thermoleophilaceae bacterium]